MRGGTLAALIALLALFTGLKFAPMSNNASPNLNNGTTIKKIAWYHDRPAVVGVTQPATPPVVGIELSADDQLLVSYANQTTGRCVAPANTFNNLSKTAAAILAEGLSYVSRGSELPFEEALVIEPVATADEGGLGVDGTGGGRRIVLAAPDHHLVEDAKSQPIFDLVTKLQALAKNCQA